MALVSKQVFLLGQEAALQLTSSSSEQVTPLRWFQEGDRMTEEQKLSRKQNQNSHRNRERYSFKCPRLSMCLFSLEKVARPQRVAGARCSVSLQQCQTSCSLSVLCDQRHGDVLTGVLILGLMCHSRATSQLESAGQRAWWPSLGCTPVATITPKLSFFTGTQMVPILL